MNYPIKYKAVFVTLIFSFSIILSEAKTPPSNVQIEMKVTKAAYNELRDSVLNEFKSIKKVLAENEEAYQRLEKSMEIANNTISAQNSLFDGFGVLYGIITIVITVLPLLVYFIQIKPAVDEAKVATQESVEKSIEIDKKFHELALKFDEKLNAKVKAIQDKSRIEKIDQAISNINIPQNEQTVYSINYISLVPNELFSELHLYKLYQASKFLTSINDQIVLASKLTTQKTAFTEEFFRNKIISENHETIIYQTVLYFAKYGLFDSALENISNQIMRQDGLYKKIVGWLSDQFPEQILSLINYDRLNDNISEKEKNEVIKELSNERIYGKIKNEISKSKIVRFRNQLSLQF
ncbi:MAG: hypothetical protein Q7W13_07630 [Bacteroidia bacterium]|nr:hypothetical protein [Bacteroidia bacterium]